MPNPNPTSDRALVRYRVTNAIPPTEKPTPVQAAVLHGAMVTPPTTALGTPAGGDVMEEFELDPPTHEIAEVERRWREANAHTDKQWVDADLLQPAPEKLPPPVPPPAAPKDAQIVRERAAGREDLPPTVTEDEDAQQDGTIRPVGDSDETFGDDELTLAQLDGLSDEQLMEKPGIGEATVKKIHAARRKAEKHAANK